MTTHIVHKIFFYIFSSSIFFSVHLKAQSITTDSLRQVERQIDNSNNLFDSIFKFNTKHPSPKKAAMYSALVPSLGQIYNRQYWKTGIVYVAIGTVTYFIADNHKNYQNFQQAYIKRLNNSNDAAGYPNLSLNDMLNQRNLYRQYKEYSILAGVVCYLINVLDAFTSAHLKTFDMSKDISIHTSPYRDQLGQQGIKLAFSFK